jgi:hypothetical protein
VFKDRRHLLADHAGWRGFVIAQHEDNFDGNFFSPKTVRAFTLNGQ